MLYYVWIVFCFFKQKAAYELRISDWSSDVCSSYLTIASRGPRLAKSCRSFQKSSSETARTSSLSPPTWDTAQPSKLSAEIEASKRAQTLTIRSRVTGGRSEEHTSELQSLMRISYAVFCLKQQKNNTDSQKVPN